MYITRPSCISVSPTHKCNDLLNTIFHDLTGIPIEVVKETLFYIQGCLRYAWYREKKYTI